MVTKRCDCFTLRVVAVDPRLLSPSFAGTCFSSFVLSAGTCFRMAPTPHPPPKGPWGAHRAPPGPKGPFGPLGGGRRFAPPLSSCLFSLVTQILGDFKFRGQGQKKTPVTDLRVYKRRCGLEINCQEWPRVSQNGPEWLLQAEDGPEWLTMSLHR